MTPAVIAFDPSERRAAGRGRLPGRAAAPSGTGATAGARTLTRRSATSRRGIPRGGATACLLAVEPRRHAGRAVSCRRLGEPLGSRPRPSPRSRPGRADRRSATSRGARTASGSRSPRARPPRSSTAPAGEVSEHPSQVDFLDSVAFDPGRRPDRHLQPGRGGPGVGRRPSGGRSPSCAATPTRSPTPPSPPAAGSRHPVARRHRPLVAGRRGTRDPACRLGARRRLQPGRQRVATAAADGGARVTPARRRPAGRDPWQSDLQTANSIAFDPDGSGSSWPAATTPSSGRSWWPTPPPEIALQEHAPRPARPS